MKITINLLPPNKKEKIRTQRLTGVVLKVGFSAIMALIVFDIFLLSCFFIIGMQDKIVEGESEQLKRNSIYKEVQLMYDVVDKYYQDTQKLDKSLSGQISNVTVLEEVNNLIPEKIFLQEVSISEGQLMLSGFSSGRDSLLEFRDKLESSQLFDGVEAPISNFTSSENVNFNFTVGLKE